MIIRLQLQGPLQKYGNTPGFFEYETAVKECTLEELLRQLGLPVPSIALITVNGLKSDLSRLLEGGDTVVVFPRVAGG
ncbi:MAG: MoaD/ThiS family protein [Bacillota bacterium]